MLDAEGHIKLVDFGFARKVSNDSKARTNCGTIGYAAPEVIIGTSQYYTFAADLWSFGILLIELITG